MRRKLLLGIGLTLLVGVLLLLILQLYWSGMLWGPPRRRAQLIGAVWSDDTNQVAQLLRAGVDPNIHSRTVRGATPLIDAVMFGHLGQVELLLQNGADPNIPDRFGHAALYEVLTSPYLDDTNDGVAVPIMNALLSNGADVGGLDVSNALKDLQAGDPRLTRWKLR